MNDERMTQLMKWKLLGETSCAKCKFLYYHDTGYSNYTVENTDVLCALDRNSNLIGGQDLPYDWNYGNPKDNWRATASSRCEHYGETDTHVRLDVDHENYPSDFASELDAEAISAIEEHSGRVRPSDK